MDSGLGGTQQRGAVRRASAWYQTDLTVYLVSSALSTWPSRGSLAMSPSLPDHEAARGEHTGSAANLQIGGARFDAWAVHSPDRADGHAADERPWSAADGHDLLDPGGCERRLVLRR